MGAQAEECAGPGQLDFAGPVGGVRKEEGWKGGGEGGGGAPARACRSEQARVVAGLSPAPASLGSSTVCLEALEGCQSAQRRGCDGSGGP